MNIRLRKCRMVRPTNPQKSPQSKSYLPLWLVLLIYNLQFSSAFLSHRRKSFWQDHFQFYPNIKEYNISVTFNYDVWPWTTNSAYEQVRPSPRGLTYIHTCRSYVHTPLDFTNGASLTWRLRWRISKVMFTCRCAWPARWRFVLFWASGVVKFTKIGDSLPWAPINRRGKFDAARFILGRTNKHTNSNRYIHTLPIGMCG